MTKETWMLPSACRDKEFVVAGEFVRVKDRAGAAGSGASGAQLPPRGGNVPWRRHS